MNKHKQYKQKIADALKLKWFRGRDADWGSMDILSLKGTSYTGVFIADLETLTGDEQFVLMSRIADPVEGSYIDTDILHFDSAKDDVDFFIQKLLWE